MSVTPIRGVSDAELLRLALRRAGYVHPGEIMELDEDGWCLAASNAGLHDSPNTATRCATWHLFGSPSLEGAQTPDSLPTAGSASLPESVGWSPHGIGTVPEPTGSISRKGST